MTRTQQSDEQRAPARNGRPRRLQWPMLLWLTTVWVLLWGQITIANILSGMLVAILVKLVFPLPPIVFEGRVRPWALLKLIGRFNLDLVRASIDVSIQTLKLRVQPMNAVIQVHLQSRSDLSLTVVSELISLTPGSVVIEARRSTHTLFLHVLDAGDEAGVEETRRSMMDLERRVVAAIGSDADYERICAPHARSSRKGGRR